MTPAGLLLPPRSTKGGGIRSTPVIYDADMRQLRDAGHLICRCPNPQPDPIPLYNTTQCGRCWRLIHRTET